MEMLHAKSKERLISLVELGLILLVGLAISLVYLFNQHSMLEKLTPKFIEIMYRQGHIAILIGVFVLFNTTYYSFVSYKSKKMFILSIAAAAYAASYVFFFLASFMRIGLVDQFNVVNVELEVTVLATLFFLGLSISHHYDQEEILSKAYNHKFMVPILYGFLITVATVLLLGGIIRFVPIKGQILIITSLKVINIGGACIILILEVWRYWHDRHRYQIRMATSVSILMYAFLVSLFKSNQFALDNCIFNGALFIGLLSYTYAAFKYNINMPVQQQKSAERQITLYAENLEKIVTKRTAELRRGTEQFLTDIEYAKRIQQSLLPGEEIHFDKVDIVAAYYPCARLSGDFYDVFMIDHDTIGMYVLDVSGHGIPAALMTMFCMNYIKTSERLINQYRAKKPHRNLKHFFEEFNKVNFPDEMHMVMFFAAYDMRSRVLTYCSGGMNTLPYVIKVDGSTEKLDQSSGFPICRVGNFFSPEFHSAKIELNIGDRIIFYTDGLTDKGKNFVYDDSELLDHLVKTRFLDLAAYKSSLIEPIMQVINKIDDDITFFIMEVK